MTELESVPHEPSRPSPAHYLGLFDKRLEYKKVAGTMPCLAIHFGQTAAQDLTTTMTKIRTPNVTRLRVAPYSRDWPTTAIEMVHMYPLYAL